MILWGKYFCIGIITWALLCTCLKVSSQVHPIYSQYQHLPTFYNPGAFGLAPGFNSIFFHRKIVGDIPPDDERFSFKGFGINYGIDKSNGFGIYVAETSSDLLKDLKVTAGYSRTYLLNRKKKKKIHFGIQASALNYRNVVFGDTTQGLMINSEMVPNFGFGMYYSIPKFYFGFSVPHILSFHIKDESIVDSYGLNISDLYTYVTAGIIRRIGDKSLLTAGVLVRTRQDFKMYGDAYVNFLVGGKIWTGVGYRTKKTVIFSFGMNILPKIKTVISLDCAVIDNDAPRREITFAYGLKSRESIFKFKSKRRYLTRGAKWKTVKPVEEDEFMY